MAFSDEWVDKVDGVDIVSAEDINSIAHVAGKNEEDIGNLKINLWYGACPTLGNVTEKVVTTDAGFVLREGVMIMVHFSEGGSCPNATLNVNNTGAKGIDLYNELVNSSTWGLNANVLFIYIGNRWKIVHYPTPLDPTEGYSLVKLSDAVNSSDNAWYWTAATPYAVKTAYDKALEAHNLASEAHEMASDVTEWVTIADGETTEEVNRITVSADMDGNPFELVDMISIHMFAPQAAVAGNATISFNATSGVHGALFSAFNASSGRYSRTLCVYDGKMWQFISCGSPTSGNTSVALNTPAYVMVEQPEKVTSISLYRYNASDVIPVGTQYRICGRVKKNASA